jgi:DNA (cytosine-5)-methyltransferase 1
MFTFIDLFAGIGGMRIAFEKAGGKCVFSSEWDKSAQDTYEANFGEMPEGDITKIDPAKIPDHDILVAGFPCQPFSIAGVSKKNSLGREHGFKDKTQGTLFFDIVRILEAKKPKAFLLENVKNLKSHDHGKTFKVILGVLKELNYNISYKILDAAGIVPQHRERIFIVGFLEASEKTDLFDGETKESSFCFPVPQGHNVKLRDILDKEVLDKYTLTDGVMRCLERHKARHKAKGNGFGFKITDIDGVSKTLSARYYKDGAEILIPQDGKNPRRLTPTECRRLMGFPDNFKIPSADAKAYKQFGNSVVVPLIELIAKAIVKKLK